MDIFRPLFLFLVLLLVASRAVQAQTCSTYGFTSLCRNIKYNGCRVTATCSGPNGNEVTTSIDLNSCFSNNGGGLACGSGFQGSCRSIRCGKTISAKCANPQGVYSSTAAAAGSCITNFGDGRLRCCSGGTRIP